MSCSVEVATVSRIAGMEVLVVAGRGSRVGRLRASHVLVPTYFAREKQRLNIHTVLDLDLRVREPSFLFLKLILNALSRVNPKKKIRPMYCT